MGLIIKADTVLARMVLLVSFVIMGVWACAGRPFDPPRTDEIPKEPGIFTQGADGAVLYDSNKKRSPAETHQTPPTASAGTQQPAVESGYQDYEAYRQWLLWKQSAVGTPEYEEFQQWREWRKYLEWEKQK